MSLHRAWDYMNENDIQTLAVVDEDRRLKGLLTLGDICLLYTSLLNDDDRAVFAGKVNLNAVNARDAALAAAERLTADGHYLTGGCLLYTSRCV